MIDNSKEYIICAAIRRIEPCSNHIASHNKEILNVELGPCHPDILQKHRGVVSKKAIDQGFFTSKFRFVSREEAEKIARECGQLEGDLIGGMLTSEDLWFKN